MKILRIGKIIMSSFGLFIILSILLIAGLAINNIDTASGCIGDYVKKIQTKQLTGGCSWYCQDVGFHQDSCDKSFEKIGCQVVAKTNGPRGCDFYLNKDYFKDKSFSDKLLFYTVNKISCEVDYKYVKYFGNKNWRDLLKK